MTIILLILLGRDKASFIIFASTSLLILFAFNYNYYGHLNQTLLETKKYESSLIIFQHTTSGYFCIVHRNENKEYECNI